MTIDTKKIVIASKEVGEKLIELGAIPLGFQKYDCTNIK